MEPGTTNAMKQIRHAGGSLFRRSRLSIGTRLSACFVAIVVSMIAADAVAVWQVGRMAAPAQRLSAADRASLAIVRVHLDVDAFQDRATELARSHDARQFANEVSSLRHTFLDDVEQTEQALGESPVIEQDPTISSALETLKVALLSQLDTMLAFATAGDWNALGLRLVKRSQDPIQLSSLLVERLNQQVLEQRARAVENTQQARRQLFIAIPIAALLTLSAAAALGWYTTRIITVPLSELALGAQALARGDFQHQVEVGGNDELTVLGKAFNYAARRLNELYEGLRRSESYLAQAQRLARTGSWVWEVPERNALYISEEWYRIFGFDPTNGMPNWEQRLQRVYPEDRAQWQATIDRAIAEKSDYDVEFRILPPDVPLRFIRSVGRPVLSPSGELVQFVGVAMDITESRLAEAERERLREELAHLAHLNRVSTLGELTASLAHEIKQPIGAAVTNAETSLRLLGRDQPDLPEVREAALEMVRDARRAADIIDRVGLLYQKGSSQMGTVDVNEVIGQMMVMLLDQANRHSVTVHTDLTEGLPQVKGDRVQLQQVLMNLMLNGIEAMRDAGGELIVKSQLGEGAELLISVADNGVGLPVDKADQIFNAFFTTKPQGTGLGLSITRSILESHGGRVWATGNSGRGATFHFTLPIRTAVSA